MFATLLWKEIRSGLLTFRFAAALIVLFTLMIVATSFNAGDYLRRADAYQALSFESKQKASEVYIPSQIRPLLHWPPSKLSIFVQGEDSRLGNSVQITRWEVPTETSDTLADNRLMAALRNFDLLSIFTVALSLLGLIMSYDAVSGERESGLLKLALSYPVRRGVVYLAKFLALLFLLVFALAQSFLASLLILSFIFEITFSVPEYAAIGMMFLLGVLTAAISIGLGILSSTIFRSSAISLLAALVLWLFFSLLSPSVALDLARSTSELRSPDELSIFRDETEQDIQKKMWKFRTTNAPKALEFMGDGYGSERPYIYDAGGQVWKDVRTYFLFYEDLHKQRAQQVYSLWREHDAARARQAEQAASLSAITPFHHLRVALTNLANTGYDSYEQLLELARRYRAQMLDNFRDRSYFGENVSAFISRRSESEMTDEAFQNRLRQFEEKAQNGAQVVELLSPKQWGALPSDIIPPIPSVVREPNFSAALLPTAILTIIVIALFVLGSIRFMRYDVR